MDVKIDAYTRLSGLLEDKLIATAVEDQSQSIGHKIWHDEKEHR
jgi:hypothetical protein